MAKGAIFVDHTTASADVARELYAAAEGRASASSMRRCRAARPAPRTARLTVMCGGDADAYAKAEPVIAAYAKACRLMGPSGSGPARPRWSTRSASPASCRACPRALHFAKRAGLDVEAVLAVISKGAAQSWQMENRGKTMAEGKFDFGFAVDWMRKDLGICLDRGRGNGAHAARDGPGRPVLCAKSRRWAAGAGTRRASSRRWSGNRPQVGAGRLVRRPTVHLSGQTGLPIVHHR